MLVRLLPDGADRGRRGPVLLPVVTGVVGPLFEEPGAFDRDALAARLQALASDAHLHRRQLVEVRRLARADLPRANGTSRAASSRASCSRASACTNMPRRSRPCAAISPSTSSPPTSSGSALPADARAVPVRLQSARADHLQGLPDARALRAAGGQGQRGISGRRHVPRDVSAPAAPLSRQDRAADFRVRRVQSTQVSPSWASFWTASTRSSPRCRRSSAMPSRSAIPDFSRRTTSPVCAATESRMSITRGRRCRSCSTRSRFRTP